MTGTILHYNWSFFLVYDIINVGYFVHIFLEGQFNITNVKYNISPQCSDYKTELGA